MAATLVYSSLGATLHGVKSDNVWQFRGLGYASIPRRFASPAPPADPSGDVDCTRFGPRCPQNNIAARHLLQIPEDEPAPEEDEDELGCLSLDVTMPELPNDSGARSAAATTGLQATEPHTDAFDLFEDDAVLLKKLYGIVADRPWKPWLNSGETLASRTSDS
ncbi:putative Carboxylic ester hydrolase [Seiridium unicorne]|uniref:Carboxylic ester hydrolase n=1 Tax=Seiridium unicorne TaxID=138068 RepID=A0ABR2VEK2_9PEZI